MTALQVRPCTTAHPSTGAEIIIGDNDHLGGRGHFSLTPDLGSTALPEEAAPQLVSPYLGLCQWQVPLPVFILIPGLSDI